MIATLVELGADLFVVDKYRHNLLMQTSLNLYSLETITKLKSLGLHKEELVCTKIINEKLVAVVWGLKGKTNWRAHNGKIHEHDLEGIRPKFGAKAIFDYISAFFVQFLSIPFPSGRAEAVPTFKDMTTIDDGISVNKTAKEHVETHLSTIKQAFSRAYPLMIEPVEVIIKRLQDGERGQPHIILGGTGNHTVSIVLCNNKLIVCNRGLGSDTRLYSSELFSLPRETLTTEIINNLQTLYTNIESFYEMIDTMELIRLGGYSQKKQKVGNCVWASAKAAFGALCQEYLGKEMGWKIYRSFTLFARKKALADYLKQPDLIQAVISEQIAKKRLAKSI